MHDLSTIIDLNEEATRGGTPTIDDVREYVARDISLFVKDAPASDFQTGYLAALVDLARGALREDQSAEPYRTARLLLCGSIVSSGESIFAAGGPEGAVPNEGPYGPGEAARVFAGASEITVQSTEGLEEAA